MQEAHAIEMSSSTIPNNEATRVRSAIKNLVLQYLGPVSGKKQGKRVRGWDVEEITNFGVSLLGKVLLLSRFGRLLANDLAHKASPLQGRVVISEA